MYHYSISAKSDFAPLSYAFANAALVIHSRTYTHTYVHTCIHVRKILSTHFIIMKDNVMKSIDATTREKYAFCLKMLKACNVTEK